MNRLGNSVVWMFFVPGFKSDLQTNYMIISLIYVIYIYMCVFIYAYFDTSLCIVDIQSNFFTPGSPVTLLMLQH